MEFKFRATDKQASPQIPSSSSIGYFTEQALRARYTIPDPGRSTEVFRRPGYLSEAIQRELEKDQIRSEIISAEIARRRLLEAEVRRELLLEREVALRRGEGFSLLSGPASGSAFRFERRLSLLHELEGRSLEERLALSLEERLASQGRPGFGGLERLPFQRNVEPEAKPPPEDNKEKVICLPRLEGNLSGTKRKAVTPPAAGSSELPTVGLKKKLKEEWSCALCQVSATSEQGLDDHLKGKKHKAKEAALIGQSGKNYTIGLFPKKAGKPIIKLAASTNNQNLEQEKKPENEPQQVKQNSDLALQVIEKSNDSSKKNGDSSRRMRKNGDHKKKRFKFKNGDHKKKRFKFWCEMCQAGAYYEKVMNAHKNGKKHAARLLELNKNGGGSAVAAQGEEEASKNDKHHEVVVKDEKEAPDNVFALDNVSGPSEDGEALEEHRAAED